MARYKTYWCNKTSEINNTAEHVHISTTRLPCTHVYIGNKMPYTNDITAYVTLSSTPCLHVKIHASLALLRVSVSRLLSPIYPQQNIPGQYIATTTAASV